MEGEGVLAKAPTQDSVINSGAQLQRITNARTTTSIAQIGPVEVNAREIPTICWLVARRAARSAKVQEREQQITDAATNIITARHGDRIVPVHTGTTATG